MKSINGITAATPKKLLLDAGAFYRNYDLSKPYTEQSDALIGATSGGGSFSAVPTIRKYSIDGAKENVKGLMDVDQWNVTIVANVEEVTVDSLKLAIGMASEESATEAGVAGYTRIKAKSEIGDEDYLDNITWIGRLRGNAKPIIIVVHNAISLNGLSLNFADKSEAKIALTLTACYEMDDMDTDPFEILYPGE